MFVTVRRAAPGTCDSQAAFAQVVTISDWSSSDRTTSGSGSGMPDVSQAAAMAALAAAGAAGPAGGLLLVAPAKREHSASTSSGLSDLPELSSTRRVQPEAPPQPLQPSQPLQETVQPEELVAEAEAKAEAAAEVEANADTLPPLQPLLSSSSSSRQPSLLRQYSSGR